MTPIKGTTFRIPPELRSRLDAEAARNSRSANAELNILIREALDARDSRRRD
jgi:predicted DNA-binding protein